MVYLYLFREQDPEALANPYLPKRVRKSKRNAEEDLDAEYEDDAEPEYVNLEGGTGDAGYMKGDESTEEDDASFYGEESDSEDNASAPDTAEDAAADNTEKEHKNTSGQEEQK